MLAIHRNEPVDSDGVLQELCTKKRQIVIVT